MEAFIGALVVTSLSAFALLPLLRRRVLDVPGHRSSHEHPTPRGGGIAIAAGVAAGVAIGGISLDLGIALTAALILGVVGFADDLHGLPASTRLGAQILAGASFGLWVARVGGPLENRPWLVAVVFTMVWLVGYTNAFNFMDGINGISAAQLGVYGFALVAAGRFDPALGIAGWASVGVAVGFLPWNYPAARMFMGDVGSYFAGAWIAATAVVAFGAGAPIIMVLAPLSLYLADTTTTLVRRVRRGAVWHTAHREHTYQRLVSAGWSHGLATAVVAGFQATALLLGVAAIDGGALVAVAWIGAVVLSVMYLTLPAMVAGRSDERPGWAQP